MPPHSPVNHSSGGLGAGIAMGGGGGSIGVSGPGLHVDDFSLRSDDCTPQKKPQTDAQRHESVCTCPRVVVFLRLISFFFRLFFRNKLGSSYIRQLSFLKIILMQKSCKVFWFSIIFPAPQEVLDLDPLATRAIVLPLIPHLRP